MKPLLAVACALMSIPFSIQADSYAQKLGWGKDDVVVILHVDDVGMSHSSNRGIIETLENGVATSFSIMMPCPWVPEIAEYIKKNPSVDAGLHLTLTSEWKSYRWGPLAGKPAVPGLVDEQGCLWHSVQQVAANATPDEIEKEIRAQIERAERMGLPITHLDSHMGTLFARVDYFERFVKVGLEKRIPILAAGGHLTHASQENPEAVKALRPVAAAIWAGGLPVLDDVHTSLTYWKAHEKKDRFLTLLKELKPGVTEILFHASIPSDVFPLITGSSDNRHEDAKLLMDPDVKKFIHDRGIKLTTWKELMERRQRAR